jgi:Protein of unknown function (DUF2281)
MTDLDILSKFAVLPSELKAEVIDFVDFLLQKVAKTQPQAVAGAAQKAASENQPLALPQQGRVVEDLGPLTDLGNPRIPFERGAGKHIIAYIADDFDAPLEDFKEYM